jgi:peptidoglycan/xylan/chitin deacetylase (PgdA/CDA1 family)
MHDDQPMPLRVKSGRLISIPYTMDINDGALFRAYGDGDYFVRACKAQFDQLYEESADSSRVMCLALHPCWTGQPHRIRYLNQVLDYICRHHGVWITTAGEIADYFMANHYDAVTTYTDRLNSRP